ncbi:MAG: DUF4198 domain-containing protein [Acidobacteriota bacterium]
MRSLVVVVGAALFPLFAAAHDFWIEPSTFRPAVGTSVGVSLRVGQQLQGDPLPRIPRLIDRFVLRGRGAETPVAGQPGADPAGTARIAEGGLHWLGYQTHAYPVTLEAKKFEDYLKEEGLESIIARRKALGQSAAPGREQFHRCAKALLWTDGGDTVSSKPLGFTLELVPRKNPYTLRAGASLPLTLLWRGKPVADGLVVAMNRDAPQSAVRARTNAKGEVSLPLARTGLWLVKAVTMGPAPAGADADWESWWASLTFELR